MALHGCTTSPCPLCSNAPVTSAPQITVHYCNAFPCSVCGAGYVPGAIVTSADRLSDEDVERIAERVIAKMHQRRRASS